MTGSSNINGVVSNSCTTTLSFVLKAKKKGEFKIGKAKIKCKNESNSSKEINMTVVDANEAHDANAGVAKFYYAIESNKDEVYVGEPFVISFYLYTEILPEEIAAIAPGNAASLWRQPLFDERDPTHVFKRTIRKVKGKEYHVIELRKEVCFASNPGNLFIDAYFGRAVERYGFFDNTYFEGYSNTLNIKVKKLPFETPENYFGMAGNFTLTHEISETSVQANRSIEMKVKLEGIGNFHQFSGPDFDFPEDTFLITEPEIVENFEYTEEGVKGSIEYTYVITPTKEGEYLILPYSFTYFDWKSKQMKAVTTHDMVFNISKGVNPAIITQAENDAGVDVESDIRYIHTNSTDTFRMSDFLFGRLWFWLIVMLPPLGAFLFFIIKRRRSSRSEDEILATEQKTIKRTAVKQIQQFKGLDTKEGVSGLKRSMEEYFMTNLNIGRSSLSKREIKSQLDQKGINQETVLSFELIWDKMEMAQYAPMTDDNVNDLFAQAEQLIQNLNKQL